VSTKIWPAPGTSLSQQPSRKTGSSQEPALKEDVKLFWEVFEAHYDEIQERRMEVVAEHPALAAVLRNTPPEQLAEQQRLSRELMRRAVLEDDWEPYLANLRAQGSTYAQAGLTFQAWFDLVAALRSLVVPHLLTTYGESVDRLQAAFAGMNRITDVAMATIGQAYLESKEETIHRQKEAMRELSTPVLQLRDRLLIVPIIGVVDSQRARQLTENLLRAIRDHRAKVVVIDITGVPDFDSGVANHLVQTVDASRLMGATAIVTGLSAEVAQTLVTLGMDLSKLNTVGDLQGGIEEANRLLGYRLVMDGGRSSKENS
jgi:anti-anti-sigma regulatory factor